MLTFKTYALLNRQFFLFGKKNMYILTSERGMKVGVQSHLTFFFCLVWKINEYCVLFDSHTQSMMSL